MSKYTLGFERKYFHILTSGIGRIIAFASLVSLFSLSPVAAKTYDFNLSTALAPDDPIYAGFKEFKKNVEKRTDKKVRVRLFPSGQLGADGELIQQAQVGSNVGVLTDGGRLAQFVPELAILNAPFLLSNYEQASKFVATPLFKGWESQLQDKSGLVSLSFNWYQGSRMMITKKPFTQPADLKGVRVRVPDAPIVIETINCMGASPTPMAWSEVYSAIQTGVVDAAEAHPTALYGSKLNEVAKYITKTNHYHLMTSIVVGRKWFEQLPAEYQKVLHEESVNAGTFASQKIIEQSNNVLEKMTKSGAKVEEIDLSPFITACANVPAKLGLESARDSLKSALGIK
ncbi:C4-dicarboxylate ABC transporter [Pectobacterium actinidiae]|uniref:C4-dicarboxylate ABC transporter n=1 Tax=Pectobacterium actinidiae TaxID=1507808 RepID=A0A1V2R183_9GAMM|nr:C4-dicarboxylate TRAP transporter substrate-binding protein [Pectobacterium actinidiae]KHN90645.1 TRAP dicarboxylate transporter, DctP subunit precursor [Pectobacterium actinidiae]MDY4314463.1 C4-dicarboxylate TRAP transporter substrate-binding protein [Pectobacterium actinidiae]ONK02561.1 C4-dicarboxylate ABC transporter [Pectobacterium actinidiae]ONK03821.1 C4-dicarboxylate ABC transporter [Pectobacterium actinidiae]